MLLVSSGTKFVEYEENATNRPSSLSIGPQDTPSPSVVNDTGVDCANAACPPATNRLTKTRTARTSTMPLFTPFMSALYSESHRTPTSPTVRSDPLKIKCGARPDG